MFTSAEPGCACAAEGELRALADGGRERLDDGAVVDLLQAPVAQLARADLEPLSRGIDGRPNKPSEASEGARAAGLPGPFVRRLPSASMLRCCASRGGRRPEDVSRGVSESCAIALSTKADSDRGVCSETWQNVTDFERDRGRKSTRSVPYRDTDHGG